MASTIMLTLTSCSVPVARATTCDLDNAKKCNNLSIPVRVARFSLFRQSPQLQADIDYWVKEFEYFKID